MKRSDAFSLSRGPVKPFGVDPFFFASVMLLAGALGCQTLFPIDGNRGNLTGTGADGGVCTKDQQTIKNVMLAPPICSATAPCPCGTFCSSQTGGNCVADCVDDSWCAPGYLCSPFGQCLKNGTGDGGVATTTDPSCPRNGALLATLTSTPRSCDFDDACPYGSFCNHLGGTCATNCSGDSDCASMSTAGHTFVCGCLGQCVEVAAPRKPPATLLPSLELTPSQYTFTRPMPVTTPNWGDTDTRVVSVVAVAPFLTMSGTTITGPAVSIRANPGAGLLVMCPPSTSLSPSACSVTVDPTTFKKVGDVYRSAPIDITVGPSLGAPTATAWSLRLESNDLSNTPQIVNLRYADATDLPSPLSPAPVVAPDATFTGQGTVRIGTPTGATIQIAVKARAWNGNLVLFDETRQLSPSGKLVLTVPVDFTTFQPFIDASGTTDVALQDSLLGGISQRLVSYSLFKDTVSDTMSGTFQRSVYTDFPLFYPATGVPTSPFDQPTMGNFIIAKLPAAAVGACNVSTDCA